MAKRKVDFYCYDSALKGWTLINSREIFDDNGKALELGADGIEGRVERHDQLKADGIPLLRYWADKGTWFVYENEDKLPKGHVVRSGLAKKKSLVIVEAPTEDKPKAKRSRKPKAKQTRKAKAKATVEADPELVDLIVAAVMAQMKAA